MWVCSAGGRWGIAWERGHEFKSYRPRSHEFYGKKYHDLRLPWLKKIKFFLYFFISRFAERRALGKAFAECPINSSRQKNLCRSDFRRGRFVEGSSLSAKQPAPLVFSGPGYCCTVHPHATKMQMIRHAEEHAWSSVLACDLESDKDLHWSAGDSRPASIIHAWDTLCMDIRRHGCECIIISITTTSRLPDRYI
jgi:hypothetical protein